MPGAVRVVDRIVDQGDYQALLALAAGDVLRYSGSKWRNYAASGATLPTSPVVGQVFLHTPTGRSNLMVYDGTAWRPLYSIGNWTVYVDGASGSDDQDKGFGTGTNAFATVQYAVDQIAPQFSGNIVINVAAGTYAETVTVRGKFAQGPVSIIIRGTMNVVETVTATGGTQGSGASHGTVTAASWGSHTNKWLLGKTGANNGVYRIIDEISGATATIVGYWATAPASGHEFDVVEPGTTVNQINAGDGQTALVVENIAFAYQDSGSLTNYTVGANSVATWRRCRQVFTSGSTLTEPGSGYWIVEECFFSRCRLMISGGSTIVVRGCKWFRSQSTGTTGRSLFVNGNSFGTFLDRPSVFDGNTNPNMGISLTSSGSIDAASLYLKIRNYRDAANTAGRGVNATHTGVIIAAANFQYSNNYIDSFADSATYGVA